MFCNQSSKIISCVLGTLSLGAMAQRSFAFSPSESIMSIKTPFAAESAPNQIVLQNDSFVENGGQAYLQEGFVTGEMAGIWVQVPKTVKKFKVDAFRVLIGSAKVSSMNAEPRNLQVFFRMGSSGPDQYSPGIPAEIQNAAQITPGPYWNDIPAEGAESKLGCVDGGHLVGAAIEFTHDGVPSIYRDLDGISDVRKNSLMAIPGGWQYSVSAGLRGDWVMRVVGHEAKDGECK